MFKLTRPRLAAMGLCAALTAASGAQAAVVLSDNFDGENGGLTALNYAGFTNFDVFGGSVDLTRSGDYYACVGGTGSCVDLDGTTSSAGFFTGKSFAFNAGDEVKLSFQLSGNRRDGMTDNFQVGYLFGGATNITGFYAGGAYGPGGMTGDILGVFGQNVGSSVASGSPFQLYTVGFTALTGGSLKAYFKAFGDDNIGPVLDNVKLEIGPAAAPVPEPTTWAMMLIGFGGLGAMLRRRRAALT